MNAEAPRYKAASKYFGETAANYEDRRFARDRWQHEQRIVSEYVRGLPLGSSIADVPFGTGRFGDLYIERELNVFGADISKDMVAIAKKKLENAKGFRIEIAAAEALPLPDRSVDYLISHRFIKWLPDITALNLVVAEFARVTRREMLLQVKLSRPKNFVKESVRALRAMIKWERASSREFSECEIAKVVRDNGFRIKSISHHDEIGRGVAYYIIERNFQPARLDRTQERA